MPGRVAQRLLAGDLRRRQAATLSQRPKLDRNRRHRLVEAVVQLARETAPLVLLGRKQAGGQTPQVVLIALQFIIRVEPGLLQLLLVGDVPMRANRHARLTVDHRDGLPAAFPVPIRPILAAHAAFELEHVAAGQCPLGLGRDAFALVRVEVVEELGGRPRKPPVRIPSTCRHRRTTGSGFPRRAPRRSDRRSSWPRPGTAPRLTVASPPLPADADWPRRSRRRGRPRPPARGARRAPPATPTQWTRVWPWCSWLPGRTGAPNGVGWAKGRYARAATPTGQPTPVPPRPQ